VRVLIVEDGYQRGALAAARALGEAGWHVGIAARVRDGFAASSRWTRATHLVPGPATDPDGFVDAVADAVAREGYELVFPAGDGELLALSERRERIPAVFPYADHRVVLCALDKRELNRAASALGFAIPQDRGGDGPFVVKPRLTIAPGRERLRAVLAGDRPEAEAAVEALRRDGAEALIQPVVPGRLLAVIGVADRQGFLRARAQQVASAVWPSGIGGSARAETVPVDRELAVRVEALLRELGWFGLNGRFYGSLALALAAGPNLPAIWAALATGREPPPGGDARPGVRYHWLEADLRRAGPKALPYALRAAHGLWRSSDPVPAGRHTLRLARRALRKATAKISSEKREPPA
jgi:hypothetical protein